jgi:hypothetical protein
VEVCLTNQYWLWSKIIWFVTLLLLIWMLITIGEFRLDCVWYCKFRLVFFRLCIILHMLIWHFIVYNTRCVMCLMDGFCVICMQMVHLSFSLLSICICFVHSIILAMLNPVNLCGLLV